MTPGREQLVDGIAAAARAAVVALLAEHPDHSFYFFTLTTDGAAVGVGFTAWSHQALAEAADGDDEVADGLRWHYADSPFCLWWEEGFGAVNDLFQARPSPFDLPDAESGAEVELRLGAMEEAMARLDAGGLFGSGPQRDGVVLAVEVMPPDHGNVQRVRRLNPPTATGRWLAEAAEPAWTVGTGSATWYDPEPADVLTAVADLVAAGRGELSVEHWRGTALGVTVGAERAAVVLRTDEAGTHWVRAGDPAAPRRNRPYRLSNGQVRHYPDRDTVPHSALDGIVRHYLDTTAGTAEVSWTDPGWTNHEAAANWYALLRLTVR